MALEQKVRILSEALARTVDRRKFLKNTGTGLFASIAALAAGHSFVGKASAANTPDPTPACSPPGPYCNTGGGILTGCNGAHCFEHLYNGQILECRVYYTYYQVGCWTTQSGGGYWTCCDCMCGNNTTTCGCAEFSQSPAPLPGGPRTRTPRGRTRGRV